MIRTVFRVPRSRGTVLHLLRDELGDHSGLDVRVRVESRSPFRLGPDEIQTGRVPRRSFLLADPSDGPALIDFVKRSDTCEIAPALVIVRHAAGEGSVSVETFDPGLVMD